MLGITDYFATVADDGKPGDYASIYIYTWYPKAMEYEGFGVPWNIYIYTWDLLGM